METEIFNELGDFGVQIDDRITGPNINLLFLIVYTVIYNPSLITNSKLRNYDDSRTVKPNSKKILLANISRR